MLRVWCNGLGLGRTILPLLVLVGGLVFGFSGQRDLGAAQTDLTDAVILYDSHNERNSDVDLRKITDYYGLTWAKVDVSAAQLQVSQLRDEHGNIVQAAYINLPTLRGMSADSLGVLRTAVITEGLKLLITEVSSVSSEVSYLTGGEVAGAQPPASMGTQYSITAQVPEVSRQFSGQTVDTQATANDSALIITSGASRTTVIVNGGTPSSSMYPVFARYREGKGEIFLHSTVLNYDLEASRLADIYYAFRGRGAEREKYQDFSRIVPLLMFVRYAGGEETWHSDRRYANLTIDDPPLTQPFWSLAYTTNFYTGLLDSMKTHSFATTIAFVPNNYQATQPDVVNLFRENSGYYSLVVHGNNHNCPDMPASAGPTQLRATALEALGRMLQLQQTTGLSFGNDMVFPCGQYDLESLTALKQTGFNATVNGNSVPGNASRPSYFDYGMYQAELDFSGFASILRMDAEMSTPLHDLFIGRPLLVYTHPALFRNGMDAFNRWADSFNAVAGGLEWRSLDYVARRLYLEKLNDDRSVSVMFYTRNLIVRNNYSEGKAFHFNKKEASDMPISAVAIGGTAIPFTVQEGALKFDAVIPAGQEVEVTLTYSSEATQTPTPQYSVTPTASASPAPVSSPSSTPTLGLLPSFTPTPTASSTPGPSPSSTPTPNPTSTPMPNPTPVPTDVPTPTYVPSPTPTSAPAPTSTPSPTPTATSTSTPVPTPAATPTPVSIGLSHLFRQYLPVVGKSPEAL